MMKTVYDFVAVGLGPFNLSLACLTQPIDSLNGLFLERNDKFDWHPGLMLENAHLQTPFMSDLVTLADPTHPLSFLNYIKQQGRLYSFYIRENFFLLRKEYNQYCQWAAGKLDSLRFNSEVFDVNYNKGEEIYTLKVRNTLSGNTTEYHARKLILGTGPKPSMPQCCPSDDSRFTHSSEYLAKKTDIQKKRQITLVGSGQSAAEIFYDLLQGIDQFQYELNWITRSSHFFSLEYNKLTLEMTSPEWLDYFHELPSETRDRLNRQHKPLYKGINEQLVNDIYDLLYAKRLNTDFRCNILTNSSLMRTQAGDDQRLSLHFYQSEQNKSFSVTTEQAILATGYSYTPPAFLQNIHDRIVWDEKHRFAVDRYYSIDINRHEIYVQNAEFHTHGFVTPDLGMACYRNTCLIKELLGYAYYPIEKLHPFQQFSVPDSSTGGSIQFEENINEALPERTSEFACGH